MKKQKGFVVLLMAVTMACLAYSYILAGDGMKAESKTSIYDREQRWCELNPDKCKH